MTKSSSVHMGHCIYHLFKESVCDPRVISTKFVHIVTKLATFDRLKSHRIINMKLLTIHCFDSSLRNHFSEFYKIGMALNTFEYMCVIYENYFFLEVCFTLKVGSLDNFESFLMFWKIFWIWVRIIIYRNFRDLTNHIIFYLETRFVFRRIREIHSAVSSLTYNLDELVFFLLC